MVEGNIDMKHDRRRGPDFLIKTLRWLGIFGWFVMIAALYILDVAKPEEENMFTKAADVNVRTTWDPQLINYLFCLLIFGLGISIIGVFINSRRHHRKDDRFKYILITLGAISTFGIIKYLFKF